MGIRAKEYFIFSYERIEYTEHKLVPNPASVNPDRIRVNTENSTVCSVNSEGIWILKWRKYGLISIYIYIYIYEVIRSIFVKTDPALSDIINSYDTLFDIKLNAYQTLFRLLISEKLLTNAAVL